MDQALASLLGAGFLLGLRHALDADHVVAVSTLVSRHRNLYRAGYVALLWSLGHSATLLLVGLAVLVFKIPLPDQLAAWVDGAVGLVLVVLGLATMATYRRRRAHAHLHQHGNGAVHFHFHTHAAGHAHGPAAQPVRHRHPEPGAHDHPHEVMAARPSLLLGALQGLAGSSVLVLLVLAAAPSVGAGVLYIVFFSLGTAAGMLAAIMVISLPVMLAAKRWQRLSHGVTLLAGAASLVAGLLMVYRTLTGPLLG